MQTALPFFPENTKLINATHKHLSHSAKSWHQRVGHQLSHHEWQLKKK